jgi:hypothetical protein
VPFTCGSPSTFTDNAGNLAEGLVQVGLGEPIEMHKTGYKHTTEGKISSNGTFRIPCGQDWSKEHVLFAIFRDDHGFRKYTWVVRDARLARRGEQPAQGVAKG